MSRTFSFQPAFRQGVPMLIGLSGPTGSGKTFSALRLATGMQRVTGGDIWYIDTEAGRATHYAPLPGEEPDLKRTFKFQHMDFAAPFPPEDYQAAIEHAVANKASIIIVDSMSHEHEGPGGVLEMHDNFLAGKPERDREKWNFTAWVEPKRQRTRLINTIKQLGCNVIFCFRAKEKVKVGSKVTALGWMPIGGDEYLYECLISAILVPGCDGVPAWRPQMPGEQSIVKLPVEFREVFKEGQPLDEAMGEYVARWAKGTVETLGDDELAEVIFALKEAKTMADLVNVRQMHSARAWSPSQRLELRKTNEAREKELEG